MNMKKKLSFLMLAMVSACMLTSCLEDTGYTQTMDFSRIVTINRNTTPLQLNADYTGEVFKLKNLTSVDQLSLYNLQDADRAIVNIHFEVDGSYNPSMTLNSASAIKVNPIWNKPLPNTDKLNPLTDLYRMQLDSWSYPITWIAGSYLNISPIIRSVGRGSYYLKPTKVYGDTLRFDMAAEYTPTTNKSDIVDYINFDLATLTDTLDADNTTLSAVHQMLDAIEANDSVCVMVVSDYRTKGYLGTDTIVKWPAVTNYTTQLKTLVK